MIAKNEGAALMVSGFAGEVFDGTLSRGGSEGPGVSSMQQLLHPNGPELPSAVEPRVHAVDFEIECLLNKRQNKTQVSLHSTVFSLCYRICTLTTHL